MGTSALHSVVSTDHRPQQPLSAANAAGLRLRSHFAGQLVARSRPMALHAHQQAGMHQRPHAARLALQVRGRAAQRRAAATPSRGAQRCVAAAAGAVDGAQSSSTGAPQPAVVVTGASSGIGKSTAAALAARGWRVFAGVRSAEAAAELRALDSSIEPLTIDVTRCVCWCKATCAAH